MADVAMHLPSSAFYRSQKSRFAHGPKNAKKTGDLRKRQNSDKNHKFEWKIFFVKNDKVEKLYCIWKNFIVSQQNVARQ
ncbi:hypothetical protein [Croceicoccus gelatinilyticus]|uniref:hypothetical protein n=1 Tax=Croceicoccus gelatinilyticus TaxID=2835536 RepID=UPI001BCF82B0|nr:hypothetical protein [Croceicoccus gelatinilyticus]MBS7670941.1 hypothetical protein [Croceicoccus gelatinilyticus]